MYFKMDFVVLIDVLLIFMNMYKYSSYDIFMLNFLISLYYYVFVF